MLTHADTARGWNGTCELLCGAMCRGRSGCDAERDLRASLISTQIVGMVMNRYIWRIGTMATLPAPSVIDLIAPTVQHYLTGTLPLSPGDDSWGPG
ncbi:MULTISPECIES: TetR/AcrR family transcriptional regulator [Streptomyces]|uniref:TetR/AcrR family transcriptional regulator n=1 Tax=Streptomyces TaxID=1883 RepID=UPI0031CF87C7